MSTGRGRDNGARERATTAHAARPDVHQRRMDATRTLREALNLPGDVNDMGILETALAEVAAREVRRNPQFASEVRETYTQLMAIRRMSRRPGTKRIELPPLVPIRTDLPYRRSDPFAPPDLDFLIRAYGRHQLARALQDYMVDQLQMVAAQLEGRHPGTKPANRGRRDALIAYIVAHA